MKKLFLILALLAAAPLFGQTISSVAINSTGFDAAVSISNFTDLGTAALGMTNNFGPVTGLVTTSGTTVTSSSGTQFTTGGAWSGSPIIINKVAYVISSVSSATSLTLTTSAGTQSTPVVYVQGAVLFTVTRPTYYGGTVGTVTDYVWGTDAVRYAYPVTWAATTAHSLNDRVADGAYGVGTNCGSYACIQKVTACSGTCTTGGSAPTWVLTGGTCGSSPPVGCITVDNSGGNQVTWKNEGSVPLPQGQPPGVYAFDYNIATAGTMTMRISLSDFVYSADTVTVTVAPNLYHDNGPGGSGNYSSASSANMTVTNNSTLTYAQTKPVCRATWPGYERVTTNFPVEIFCASRFARNQQELESVVFTATDQHSHSVSVTASSMTKSVYGASWTNSSVPYAAGPGDQNPVLVYAGTVNISTLTQGDQITVTWLAYPWAGDSTAVFNSAVGQDGLTQPSESAGPLYYINDKSGTYGSSFTHVKSGGATSCGSHVYNTRAGAEGDSTGVASISLAASCLEAYNNANYSRADAGGGMMLLDAGNWSTGNGTAYALGTMKTWMITDKVSTLSRSQVAITSNNDNLPDNDNNTLWKIQNITISGGFVLAYGSNSGTDSLWLHDDLLNFTTSGMISELGGAVYLTQNYVTATGGSLYYNGGTGRIPIELTRGNYIGDSGGHVSLYAVFGNYGGEPVENTTSTYQAISDNAIFAFNTVYNMPDSNASIGTSQLSRGGALIQSVMEGGFQVGDPPTGATGNVNVPNLIVQHMVNGAVTTFENARTHVGYNVVGTYVNTMIDWSLKWNNWCAYATEMDTSDLCASGCSVASAPNPARIGPWATNYGTGNLGNLQQIPGNVAFNPNFFGLGFIQTGNPAYVHNPVNGSVYSDYHILPGSQDIGIAPWTTNADEVLPYDLSGAPRSCLTGIGCIGGAYMYNLGTAAIAASTIRKSQIGQSEAAAATPTFSPAAGSIISGTQITMADSSGSCSSNIFWNFTGTSMASGTNSTLSSAITTASTLYAQALNCYGFKNSAIGSAAYTISAGTITYVNSGGNNFSSCSGVTSCSYTLGWNPTSGDELIVASDINKIATLSISCSGTGCPSSWTSAGTPLQNSLGATQTIAGWVGIAAGTGSADITITTGGVSGNVGIMAHDVQCSTACSVDSYGSYTATTSTPSFSASPATTVANDYAVEFWGSSGSQTPSASGWTGRVTGQSYQGSFEMNSISSGTTVTFTGATFGGTPVVNLLIVLKL